MEDRPRGRRAIPQGAVLGGYEWEVRDMQRDLERLRQALAAIRDYEAGVADPRPDEAMRDIARRALQG